MIRRWSRINYVNSGTPVAKKTFFRYFFISFKKSIIFKKFKIKSTRFTRRALVKAKHKGNWMLYLQIFKSWVSDFKLAKSYVNYQLINRIFLTNTLTYNFMHFNFRQFNNFETSFFVNNHITKRTSSVLAAFKNSWDFSNAPTNTTSYVDFKSMLSFKQDKITHIPVYLDTNTAWYPVESLVNHNHAFDKAYLNTIAESLQTLEYRHFLEIYKILIFVTQLIILKINNYVFRLCHSCKNANSIASISK